MRLYLAGRYTRYPQIEQYAIEARALGHEITSRWHNGSHDLNSTSSDEDRERLALEDLQDLFSARDGIVVFSAEQSGRGGYHVETGYAMGRRRQVYLVGPRRNVFHYLRAVRQFGTWEEFKSQVLIDNWLAWP